MQTTNNQTPASNAGGQTSPGKGSITALVNATAPAQIIAIPAVADRFKGLYLTFHGKGAERYYEAEKFHLMKIISESQGLQNCSKLSIYGCALDLCVNGLTIDPNLKQAYLVPRKGKATLVISGMGELVLRVNAGQIKYVDNPVLVYEGDKFLVGTSRGSSFVEHEAKIPRESDNIIACYLKLTRPDGSVDYKVMTRDEVEKLRQQSDAPGSPAWTKNFAGMFMTKTIKHAFRNYPRLRKLTQSKFSMLETEIEDQEEDVDIYGLGDEIDQQPAQNPAMAKHLAQDQAAGNAPTPPPATDQPAGDAGDQPGAAPQIDLNF